MGGCRVEIADSGGLMIRNEQPSKRNMIPIASGYALKYEMYRNRNTKINKNKRNAQRRRTEACQ